MQSIIIIKLAVKKERTFAETEALLEAEPRWAQSLPGLRACGSAEN